MQKNCTKYIRIESSTENSIDKLIKEVSDAYIYNKLEPNLNTDTHSSKNTKN